MLKGLTKTQRDAIYDWINGKGYQAFFEYPDDDKIAKPFVVINISTLPHNKYRPSRSRNGTDDFSLEYNRYFTLTITYVADDGEEDPCQDLLETLELQATLTAFKAVGIAIMSTGDMVDLSRLISTRHEYIAAFEVFCSTHKSLQEDVVEIQKMDLIEYIGG